MSACPISLKYRNKQKSTLLCLWNMCIFHSLDPGSLPVLLSSHVLSSSVCYFLLPLFLALYYPVFVLSEATEEEKKSYKKYGAVNQISRLELWMGEQEIRHRARGVNADVFEDRYMAYVLWKAIPGTNPPTYPYWDAECQRNPVLQKRLPPVFRNGSRPLLNRLVEQNAFAFQGSSYSCAAVLSKRFVWFGVRQKI